MSNVATQDDVQVDAAGERSAFARIMDEDQLSALNLIMEEMSRPSIQPESLADMKLARDDDGNLLPIEPKEPTRRERIRVRFYPLTWSDRMRFGLDRVRSMDDLSDEDKVTLLSEKFLWTMPHTRMRVT